MSLKRQQEILSGFSMASMTDVVFLLLVFFMVTSTFVFPTALEVNLPQSSEQTPLKPVTRVFIQADGSLWGQFGDGEPVAMPSQQALVDFLKEVKKQAPETAIAVFGDSAVPYGDVVEILNLGADNDLKMVLATTKKDDVATTAVTADVQSGQTNATASTSATASAYASGTNTDTK